MRTLIIDQPGGWIEVVDELLPGREAVRFVSWWQEWELELYPFWDRENYCLFVRRVIDEYGDPTQDDIGNHNVDLPIGCTFDEARAFFIIAWEAFKKGLNTAIHRTI